MTNLRKLIQIVDSNSKELVVEHFRDVINDPVYLGLLSFVASRIRASIKKINSYEEIGSNGLFSDNQAETEVYLKSFLKNESAVASIELTKKLSAADQSARKEIIISVLMKLESAYRSQK